MGKRQSRLRPDEVEELVKATHFTPKELNRWYRGFLRDCPTGTLTEQEFCQIYGQFFPFGDPEPLASLIFRGFGVRRGGEGEGTADVVGFTQFITALSIATRGTIEEKIALLFRLYDSNGDGSIDREDVEKVMEAMYKMVGPLLAQETGGEQVTDDETNTISAVMSERVKEICSKLDKAGAGKVSLDQFTEAVREDESISLALKHQQHLLL